MKKYIYCLALAFLLFMNSDLYSQTMSDIDMPSDGAGLYLDEIPISGEVYFILGALGVGAYIYLRNQKPLNSSTNKHL
jgi:hypothetical protein